MIPVKQTIKHFPTKGEYGDCHRACYASILEIPIDRIPHFGFDGTPDGELFNKRCNDFLKQFGLKEAHFVYDCDLDFVFRVMKAHNEGIPYILGCKTIKGFPHSIVCINDQVFNDPAYSEPQKEYFKLDGYYWVTVLAAIDLSQKNKGDSIPNG